jgi:hypothetical protein
MNLAVVVFRSLAHSKHGLFDVRSVHGGYPGMRHGANKSLHAQGVLLALY